MIQPWKFSKASKQIINGIAKEASNGDSVLQAIANYQVPNEIKPVAVDCKPKQIQTGIEKLTSKDEGLVMDVEVDDYDKESTTSMPTDANLDPDSPFATSLLLRLEEKQPLNVDEDDLADLLKLNDCWLRRIFATLKESFTINCIHNFCLSCKQCALPTDKLIELLFEEALLPKFYELISTKNDEIQIKAIAVENLPAFWKIVLKRVIFQKSQNMNMILNTLHLLDGDMKRQLLSNFLSASTKLESWQLPILIDLSTAETCNGKILQKLLQLMKNCCFEFETDKMFGKLLLCISTIVTGDFLKTDGRHQLDYILKSHKTVFKQKVAGNLKRLSE